MLSKLLSTLRFALVGTLSLLAPVSLAETINVGPGQTYTTIQSGIDAANNGDTVLVAPGTYNENINFNGKAITVTSSGGAASTTISGPNDTPAVIFRNGETRGSVLSNFTITAGGQNDDMSHMGGVNISASSPIILNNIITNTKCYGIVSMYSSPLIQGNEISYVRSLSNVCSFADGAGIWLFGPQSGINPLVLGNTIENNTESGVADSGGNGGAGIAIWGGPVIIERNVIRNNATGKYPSPAGGGEGGGIYFWGPPTGLIANNLIYGNTSNLDGGGIAIPGPSGTYTNLTIVNNTIVDNAVVPVTTQAVLGGQQLYFYAGQGSAVTFANNIISGSTTGASVVCQDEPDSSITYLNNDLYNAIGPTTGVISAGTCTYPAGTSGNISADPMFSSATTANYHLQLSSPAVDTGDNNALQLTIPYGFSLSTDLDGNPRVQDATGKGCIIDMGAYEYTGTVSDCGISVSETLTSSLNPAMAGQTVTFTAQLTAASGTPTGAIQFLDGANVLSTQTVSGTGSATFTTNSLTVGSHTITANYQPTGTFGASTASLIQVIDGDTTGTALTCLPNPINIDNTAQLTAAVTSAYGTPTGSISFTDNGASLATQGLLNGTTSLTYTGAVAGTHNITATYAPTGSFAASSATCSEVVNALPTTSTLLVAPTTSTYGSQVTLTATVASATLPGPSTPTGVVTFYNGASAIGTGTLVGGVATLASVSLPGGSYNLTCMYGGSSIYATSNCNPVPVIINAAPTALTLSSSNNPAAYLSTVTFTVRLTVNDQSAGAGNAILLNINGQTISLTTDATGSATYPIATLPPNSYPVTARSAATNNLLASSASLTEVITAAPTSISLTAAPNPGDLNQPVTLSAIVSTQTTSTPVSSGNVTFYDGSTSLGSSQLSAAGTASLTASFTTVGVHNITAVYGGDADFSGSTSAVLKETIVAGDFSIGVLPGAATVYTGEAVAVRVSVTSLQGFNQPLTLTCSGLPVNTTCSFSPATLPEGQGAANLVIQTAAPHKAGAGSVSGSAAVLGALALLLLPGWRRRRSLLAGLSVVLLAVGVGMGMAGCGAPDSITGGTSPGTYQVAVTATAAGSGTALTHSAIVTLTVKSLF